MKFIKTVEPEVEPEVVDVNDEKEEPVLEKKKKKKKKKKKSKGNNEKTADDIAIDEFNSYQSSISDISPAVTGDAPLQFSIVSPKISINSSMSSKQRQKISLAIRTLIAFLNDDNSDKINVAMDTIYDYTNYGFTNKLLKKLYDIMLAYFAAYPMNAPVNSNAFSSSFDVYVTALQYHGTSMTRLSHVRRNGVVSKAYDLELSRRIMNESFFDTLKESAVKDLSTLEFALSISIVASRQYLVSFNKLCNKRYIDQVFNGIKGSTPLASFVRKCSDLFFIVLSAKMIDFFRDIRHLMNDIREYISSIVYILIAARFCVKTQQPMMELSDLIKDIDEEFDPLHPMLLKFYLGIDKDDEYMTGLLLIYFRYYNKVTDTVATTDDQIRVSSIIDSLFIQMDRHEGSFGFHTLYEFFERKNDDIFIYKSLDEIEQTSQLYLASAELYDTVLTYLRDREIKDENKDENLDHVLPPTTLRLIEYSDVDPTVLATNMGLEFKRLDLTEQEQEEDDDNYDSP
jgi:hypothetical protein